MQPNTTETDMTTRSDMRRMDDFELARFIEAQLIQHRTHQEILDIIDETLPRLLDRITFLTDKCNALELKVKQ